MRKHTLFAVSSLAAFGFSMSAFGYYGDDDYYTKAPIPVATPSPYAMNEEGFVVGLEGGYADTHWDNLSFPGFSITDTGFAARGFLGYDFSRYLGAELGFVYLPEATVDGFSGNIKNYAVDLLGKLSVSITSGFSLYAKAGLGYLKSSGSDDLSSFTTSHVGPAFGVGAGYEVIPNLALNLSWMRYSGNAKIGDGDYQPSPDAVLFGLSYKIPMRNS